MEFHVPAASFVTISIVALLGFIIPAALFIITQKKFKGTIKEFFVGAGTFLVFAILIEKNIQAIVLGSSAGLTIMANPLLFSLTGGLFAGVFEECGRYVAFRFILKPEQNQDKTALMYGVGHGGFEMIFLLCTGMISNLMMAYMINTGTTEQMTAALSSQDLATMTSTFQQLADTHPLAYLLALVERVPAIALHVTLSVLVWYSVKNSDRWYLFVIAILLHTLTDAVMSYLTLTGCPVLVIELILYIAAGALCWFARKLWVNQRQA